MKSWFAKYRICSAQDAGKELSPSLRRSIRSSHKLDVFEQETAALDRALKQTAPKAHVPESLHHSIMRAVRAAEAPAPVPNRLVFLRWFPVPVAVALAVFLGWHALRGPVQPPLQSAQALTTATTALEVGGQIPQAVPSAVVSPLSDELQRVHQDLTNTARFLLASLP